MIFTWILCVQQKYHLSVCYFWYTTTIMRSQKGASTKSEISGDSGHPHNIPHSKKYWYLISCDRSISRGGNLRWPWMSLQYSRFQEHFNFVRICWNCSKSIKMTNHKSWKCYHQYQNDLLTWLMFVIFGC